MSVVISFFSSVDGEDIVEGAVAGLAAGFIICVIRALYEFRKERGHIEYIRRELKDFKKSSDDIYDKKEELDYAEEVLRCEVYDDMRRIIKPVLNRLSYKKKLELSQALDWDYRRRLLTREDGRRPNIVEGQWPTDRMYKHQIDEIFKRLEGLKWLKINK